MTGFIGSVIVDGPLVLYKPVNLSNIAQYHMLYYAKMTTVEASRDRCIMQALLLALKVAGCLEYEA